MNILEKHIGLYNRLCKVQKHIAKQLKKRNITCYRLYDKDMPEHPIIVDVYEQHAVVYEYESSHKLSEEEYAIWLHDAQQSVAAALNIPNEHVHLKMRRRIRFRQEQYQKVAATGIFHTVQENGLNFITNYSDYLDTGLFLDHRITRQMVQAQSAGKKVLNLFCYTGSFSIYAKAGGAAEVWSLDLSNTYIDWCKKNDAANTFSHHTEMRWMKCDVLETLAQLPKNYFDIIISDPPTFSNSKMMKQHWDVKAHHVQHLKQLSALLAEEGTIYFSNNATDFSMAQEVYSMFLVKDITEQTTDFDFKGKLKRKCFLLQHCQ